MDDIQYLRERLDSADAAIQTLHDALFADMGPAVAPEADPPVALERIDWIEDQVTAEAAHRKSDVARVTDGLANHAHPVQPYEHAHAHDHDEYARDGHAHSALAEALAIQGKQLAALRAVADGLSLTVKAVAQDVRTTVAEIEAQMANHEHADLAEVLQDIASDLAARAEKHNQFVDEFLPVQQAVGDHAASIMAHEYEITAHGHRLVSLESTLAELPEKQERIHTRLLAAEREAAGHTHATFPSHEHEPPPRHIHEYVRDKKGSTATRALYICQVGDCGERHFMLEQPG